MNATSIQPGQITSPIQVVAAFLAALVLTAGAMLGAAAAITVEWLQALLVFTSILSVPAFLAACFLLLTRFRPQMQQDQYYAAWLERTQATFIDFVPENPHPSVPQADHAEPLTPTGADGRRIRLYEHHRGVFLIHTWRPSAQPGQVADIVIELCQHGDGPLDRGLVKSVEYDLGEKFFEKPVTKANAGENFRLEVSAYGPMLCVARVNFVDGTPPLELDRYINF